MKNSETSLRYFMNYMYHANATWNISHWDSNRNACVLPPADKFDSEA